jgi:outer membrane protein assembly factor BamB
MTPQRNAGPGAEAELPEYAGHYRLEACLGSGGMGVVHLARSTSGLRLAVKVVHAEFARDPEFRGRFRQEVAAARRVSGAFTAPVVDADPDADRPWMATLFIPGPTLSEQVKRNGPLAPAQLRRLMAGLAEALRDIHRVGVVHRDLKPSNVLLAEDGPKVIDFGISRPKDSELRTETGKLIGTPPFMAPEQFRRPREVGPAADIFALGSVLVHAATGRGPFDSDSPYLVAYQVVHDEPDLTGVPQDLAPLVQRCLAKEPEDRPTPDELMRELRSTAATYDTQAFIPAQRTRDLPLPASGAREITGHGHGHADGSGAREDGGPGALDRWRTADTPGASEPVEAPDEPDVVEPVAALDPATVARNLAQARAGDRAAGVTRDEDGDADRDRGERRAEKEAAARRSGAAPGERGQAFARRFRLRAGLVAGAVGVLVAGGFGAVQWAGRPGASGDGAHTAAAAFDTWAVEPVPGSAAVPQCSYGGSSGRAGGSAPGAGLFCAQSGQVVALDPADGSVRWRRAVAGAGHEAPVVSGGLVYVPTADGRRLQALDAASGRPQPGLELPAQGGWHIVGGTLVVAGADGTVTGVDGASGRTRWSRRIAGYSLPALASFPGNGLAWVSSSSADGEHTRITAVDPETGAVRQDATLPGYLRLVGVRDGDVFLLGLDPVYGDATSVIRYTGGSRAVHRVALPARLQSPQAVVRGAVVHLLGAGGTLQAVDMTAGRPLWQLETAVSKASAPACDGRYVYLAAADGRLLAVDARTGRLAGETRPRLGGRPGTLAAPVPADGHVFAGAPDGTVFAVDARDPSVW